jgi:transposase-like protein
MGRQSTFSTEVRERAVRLVFEQQAQHESQWAAMCSVAEKIGATADTVRRWVRQAERDAGKRDGLTTSSGPGPTATRSAATSSGEQTIPVPWGPTP